MLCDEKQAVLSICDRYGTSELIKFILDQSVRDIVDMLGNQGYGDALIEWFKECRPSEFYDEEADNAAYLDEMELRMDRQREAMGVAV